MHEIVRTARAGRATLAAVAAMVALVAVDVAGGSSVFLSGLYIVPALAVALTGDRRATLALSVAAVVLAVLSGPWNDLMWTQRWLVGLLVTVSGGIIATLFAERIGLTRELSHAERRFEAIVSGLPDAVTVRGADGALVYANEAAVRLLAVGSRERLEGMTARDTMELFDAFDEDGRPFALGDMPGFKAWTSSADPEPLLVRNVVRATGQERWLLSKAAAIRARDGRAQYVVNITTDVTASKRAELGQRLLADAGRALAASLDTSRTLREIARMAVPNLADWCAVDVRGPDGHLELIAAEHVDPERSAIARRLRERHPLAADDPDPVAAVARGDLPSWVQDETSDAMLAERARDPEDLELLRAIRPNAVMVVPLRAGDRVLGAVTFVSAQAGRFDAEELALALELGRRAGVALENARLYSERGEIAHTLQAALVPDPVPAVPGWDVAALYRPAGEGAEAGGDFYDVTATGGCWVVTVGDVSGKGARAASVTSLARFTMRTAAGITGDPHAVLSTLNASLLRRPDGDLCSAVVAVLAEEDGRASVRVLRAGHPAPLLVHRDEVRPVGLPGLLLGVAEGATWTEERLELERGDRLVLFTDGVTDAAGPGREHFGEGRLRAVLGERGGEDPGAVVDAVWAALEGFRVGAQPDDIAVVVLERLRPDEVALPGGPRAPAAARAVARERLEGLVAPDALETAVLLVSEIVSNAVRHGGGGDDGQVRLRVVAFAERIRAEVRDGGPGFEPQARAAGPDGGFGLVIVERFASRWGVDREGAVTCVWFEQPAAGTATRPAPLYTGRSRERWPSG